MIDPERLAHIPPEYHQQHSFCFWLHYLMVDVLRQAEAARIADVHFTFKDDAEEAAFVQADNPITFCLENDRVDVAKRIVINQVVIPLYSDALHFIYEGMRALEKRKYAVAFALFRKPFKYDLLFLTWLFADEDDFFARLKTEPAQAFDERKITAEQRIALLAKAISVLEYNDFLDASLIYEMAFDRGNPRGFAQYFDKANHLVTSSPAMRTENLNLNFIFKKPSDTDVYEKVYGLLGYLLVYLLFLQVDMTGRMASIPEWYRRWIATATLGTFEAVFEKSTIMIDHVNSTWDEMMVCVLCHQTYRVTAENALEFFSTEHIRCQGCGTEQQLPLFWLMSRFAKGEPARS